MKRRLISLILCILIFASLCSLQAFADGEAEAPAPAYPGAPMKLRDALSAGNRTAVMMALKSDLGSIGVVVDMKNFNALVMYPVDEEYTTFKLGTFSGKAPESFVDIREKETRSFYFHHTINEKDILSRTADLGPVSLVSYALPSDEPQEYLDPNIFFRPDPGYYELRSGVCTVCGNYYKYPQPEDHMLMECRAHYVCRAEDEGTLPHYSVCTDCGLPMCCCYCYQFVEDEFFIAIGGSGEYAVAGNIPDCITLGFIKGAKVSYIGGAKPASIEVPDVNCSDCGKAMPISESIMYNCASHYYCSDCAKKLSVDEIRTHRDALVCTHYTCDGFQHSEEIISKYCPWRKAPHRNCEGYDALHYCSGCGQVYNCADSMTHTYCIVCNKPLCTGEHTPCDYCGGKLCDHQLHGYGLCAK